MGIKSGQKDKNNSIMTRLVVIPLDSSSEYLSIHVAVRTSYWIYYNRVLLV